MSLGLAASQHSKTAGGIVHLSETIEGRTFQIEVSRVARDRWRAHIVKAPGIPTAMMPFYGPTPDEAAKLLTDWLARAYRCASGSTPPRQN